MQIQQNDFSNITETHIPLLVETYGEELAAAQLQLEHDAYTEGEARFHKALNRALENGELADSKVAKPYLTKGIELVAERIEAKWELNDNEAAQAKAEGKRYRRTNVEILLRDQIDPETLALIALKSVIRDTFSVRKLMTIQGSAGKVGKSVNDEMRFGAIRDNESQYFNKRVKNGLRKRVGAGFKLAYMQAVEGHMVDEGVLESVGEKWNREKATQVGIFLIECVMESLGWFELKIMNDTGLVKDSYQVLSPTEEFKAHFTDRAFNLAGMSPVYQPCVVPPKPWTSSTSGAYWAKGRARLSLVRTYSQKARNRYKHVDMPKVYQAVNTAQNTAWQVNTKVLDVLEAVIDWKNPVGGLPVTDLHAEDLPEYNDNGESVGNGESNKVARSAAALAYRQQRRAISQRLSLEFTLGQARKFREFDAIYFPHNLDWRGRIYAIPSFNPQGNDVTKSLLKFADAKSLPLGKDGGYWLAIHGANCMGYDKASLADRVQFVADHEEMILSCAENPLEDTRWADQDAPWCFLAFCFEWAGYKQHGEDYVCGLPVALDGTCSGLQHFSAMLRDETGGAAVNLLSGMSRQDIYGIVAEKVTERVQHDLISGSDDEVIIEDKDGEMVEKLVKGEKALAAAWLAYGITRSVTKRPVMTLAYGASKFGFTDQILEDTVTPDTFSNPASVFEGIGHQAARYLAEHIWTAVSTTVVAAVEAMKWLQSAAKLLATEVKDKKTKEVLRKALPITWVTPAGFPVWQEYVEWETKTIRTLFMGTADLSMRVATGESEKIVASRQAAGCAPNFVHSNDAAHLQLTVNHANEAYGITQFALIHDSFGAMPAQAGQLFAAVRESMVAMYESHDVIADFYEQFADQLHESQLEKMPEVPTKGNLDLSEIVRSEFAFS